MTDTDYFDQTFQTAEQIALSIGLTEKQFLDLRNAALFRNDIEIEAYDAWEATGPWGIDG